MLKSIAQKTFANGRVYALETEDGFAIETTDTFLPWYTKDAIGNKQNTLKDTDLGSRAERWMIGVSVMSGCPCKCKFCATGQMQKWRSLTTEEIIQQVDFILNLNPDFNPLDSKEFKINYTRMGEPFLNLKSVKGAIATLDTRFKGKIHHYVSTIGIKNSNFYWVKNNITLQVSLHSLNEDRRNWLIPWLNKMSIEELGKIRTESNLMTTLNLTLVDDDDFEITELQKSFDPKHFFIKLSPINRNVVSDGNDLGAGIIEAQNIA